MKERELGGDTHKLSFGRFAGGDKQEARYTEGKSGTSLALFTPEKILDTLRSTPSAEDPIIWPIRVLNELNYRGQNAEYINDNTANSELAVKTASVKENIRKIKQLMKFSPIPTAGFA